MAREKLTIISLNAWGGRALHPLMRFLQRHAPTTDVFCLQEVFNTAQKAVERRHPDEYVCGDLFNKISAALPDFYGSFARHEDSPHRMSLAMFIKDTVSRRRGPKDFVVHVPEKQVLTGSAILSSRRLQYATVNFGGAGLLIANYHGLWVNGPKTDNPERILQSQRLRAFLDSKTHPQVLCGDFNLLPRTKSVAIIAEHMRDLVAEYKVRSTRTPLYRHYRNKAEPNYADYVFTTKDVKVNAFEVLPDIASDHAALRVELGW